MILPVTFEALEKMLGVKTIHAIETDHQRGIIRIISRNASDCEGQSSKQEMILTASDVKYARED